jgi:hypothetical protein
MRSRNAFLAGALLALTAVVSGCASAPYATRMKFLDDMSAKGIEYRTQLQTQRTPPDEAACAIGWRLLDADVPYDQAMAVSSNEWQAEVKEAYIKSCMTGESLPKPDPSGIKARTPVPITSTAARERS